MIQEQTVSKTSLNHKLEYPVNKAYGNEQSLYIPGYKELQ